MALRCLQCFQRLHGKRRQVHQARLPPHLPRAEGAWAFPQGAHARLGAHLDAFCPRVLQEGVVELIHRDEELLEELQEDAGGSGGPGPYDFPESRPALLFLIDQCATAEFLAAATAAAASVIEAASAETVCGVAAFGADLDLYDLRPANPLLRRVQLSTDTDPNAPPCASVDIADVLPLEAVLRPLGRARSQALQVLDSLRPSATPQGSRSFGAAIQAVLRLIGANGSELQIPLAPEAAPRALPGFVPPPGAAEAGAVPVLAPQHATISLLGLRLMIFLAGAPDMGRGAAQPGGPVAGVGDTLEGAFAAMRVQGAAAGVSVPIPAGVSAEAFARSGSQAGSSAPQIDPAAKAFFEDAGFAAAAVGASVDLFIVPQPGALAGASCLAPLASRSGGSLLLYPAASSSDALAPDVFRRAQTRRAVNCMLRVRTPRELHVGRTFGPLLPDPQFEDLYHMGCCDPHQTVGFDFEFDSSEGFSSRVGMGSMGTPCVQVAFAYT